MDHNGDITPMNVLTKFGQKKSNKNCSS